MLRAPRDYENGEDWRAFFSIASGPLFAFVHPQIPDYGHQEPIARDWRDDRHIVWVHTKYEAALALKMQKELEADQRRNRSKT